MSDFHRLQSGGFGKSRSFSRGARTPETSDLARSKNKKKGGGVKSPSPFDLALAASRDDMPDMSRVVHSPRGQGGTESPLLPAEQNVSGSNTPMNSPPGSNYPPPLSPLAQPKAAAAAVPSGADQQKLLLYQQKVLTMTLELLETDKRMVLGHEYMDAVGELWGHHNAQLSREAMKPFTSSVTHSYDDSVEYVYAMEEKARTRIGQEFFEAAMAIGARDASNQMLQAVEIIVRDERALRNTLFKQEHDTFFDVAIAARDERYAFKLEQQRGIGDAAGTAVRLCDGCPFTDPSQCPFHKAAWEKEETTFREQHFHRKWSKVRPLSARVASFAYKAPRDQRPYATAVPLPAAAQVTPRAPSAAYHEVYKRREGHVRHLNATMYDRKLRHGLL